MAVESNANIDERTKEDAPGSIEDDNVDTAAVQDEAGADEHAGEPVSARPTRKHRITWSRVLAFGMLPGLALVLALAAGYLKWQESSAHDAQLARMQSVQTAKDATVALLSYRPDTVEKDLGAASNLLIGDVRDAYTSLTHDVVIPGSKEKQISAVANVAAAGSVSATENRAVVLVFVNQSIIEGSEAPTDTASSVRLTLEKVDGHWLISEFDPV